MGEPTYMETHHPKWTSFPLTIEDPPTLPKTGPKMAYRLCTQGACPNERGRLGMRVLISKLGLGRCPLFPLVRD